MKSLVFLFPYLSLLDSLLRFLFKNLLNFLDSKPRFSSSLSSLGSCLFLCLAAFKAMFLTCLSSLSWTLSLFISNSCSQSFPNKEVVVKDVKSFRMYGFKWEGGGVNCLKGFSQTFRSRMKFLWENLIQNNTKQFNTTPEKQSVVSQKQSIVYTSWKSTNWN